MKKSIYRLFALLLVVCTVCSTMLLPASAAVVDTRATKTGLLFEMKVTKVTSVLTTMNSSDKYFVSYELPSAGRIVLGGVLKHSVTTGYNIKSGAYYINSAGNREYGPWDSTKSGETIYGTYAVAYLAAGKTYRGIVENLNSSGYVYDGSVTLSCY